MTADPALVALVVAQLDHYYCDDCWYSCPLADGGCCDESVPKDKCNCGLVEKAEKIAAALDPHVVMRRAANSGWLVSDAEMERYKAVEARVGDLEAALRVARSWILEWEPDDRDEIAERSELLQQIGPLLRASEGTQP